MGQFDFIGTWDDSWQIVESLLELEGNTLFFDRNCAEPVPLKLKKLDFDSKTLLSERRQLFIGSDRFSSHAPVMRLTELADGTSFYWIDELRSGPLLSLTLPPCYFESDRVNLAAGCLSYSKWYTNSETVDHEPPSQALIDGYKSFVRLLKSRVVKRHRLHEWVWAGKHAIRELAENRAVLHGYGLD